MTLSHTTLNKQCNVLRLGPSRQQRATRSLCHPSHHWGGEGNGEKTAKLVGQAKGSLTEANSNNNNTNENNLQKNNRMHKATLTAHCPVCS